MVLKRVPSECMGITVISPLRKNTCNKQQNSIPLFGLIFMPPIEICLVSLNDLDKREETCYNSKNIVPMEKLLVSLDS